MSLLNDNKVRVTKLLGGSAPVGAMNPVAGLATNHGTILEVASGQYTVDVGVGSGSVRQKFYPHQLLVNYDVATGVPYLFPSGNGSILFGHNALFASGVPQGSSSGIAVCEGGRVRIVYR